MYVNTDTNLVMIETPTGFVNIRSAKKYNLQLTAEAIKLQDFLDTMEVIK